LPFGLTVTVIYFCRIGTYTVPCNGYSRMKVPALLFHNVSPDPRGSAPGITISPDQFRELIAWLARSGYTGISARDWLNAQNGKAVLPRKPVVVTFDDGYASIAEYALPVLRSHGFHATVFVVTGLIGRTNEWDTPRWRTLKLMDADELRFWATCGVEFGSHSVKHHDLTKLTLSELTHDIPSSCDELAGIVGGQIVSFAYPYGRHNETVRRVVSKSFPLAFVAHKGTVESKTDPMLCCRIGVLPNYSPERVGLYLRFASSVGFFARWLRPVRRVVFPKIKAAAIR